MARQTKTGSMFTRTTAKVYFMNVSAHDAQMLRRNLPKSVDRLRRKGFDATLTAEPRDFQIDWRHKPKTLKRSKREAGRILVKNTWGGPG